MAYDKDQKPDQKQEPDRRKHYGITLETAQEHLEQWLEAELEVTTHQSYQLGSRTLTRADLGEIRKTIEFWEDKVNSILAKQRRGRNRMYRGVPRDL